MTMDRFETCYHRTRYQVANYKFFKSLPKYTFSKNLALAMGKDGPNRLHYGVIRALRYAIRQSRSNSNKSEGEVIVAGCENITDQSWSGWWNSSSYALVDRVSAIKMLRHMYLVKARGGQEVWVYSPPKRYTEWLYDEFDGLGKAGLATWADQRRQVYSRADKKAMGDATQVAQNWAMKCIAKLGGTPSAATATKIKRWFLDGSATDAEVKRMAGKLQAGYKKIAAVLNGNKLVLSDEPIDRNGGGWKDYAFVYQDEKMSVIYIQKATLDAAKGSKMWDAALTIVHELSHRELKTDDHRYGDDGGDLGPSSGANALSEAQAFDNADNWGYFSADLNRELKKSWRKYVSGVA